MDNNFNQEDQNNFDSEKSASVQKFKNSVSTAISIVVVGALIALSIIYSGTSSKPSKNSIKNEPVPSVKDQASIKNSDIKLKPVSASDHVRGNRNAAVKIVEYSDLECPYCKYFHITMKQVLSEYSGQIAWVYRHFPIAKRHPKAQKEAEATECANELGGDDKFWAYLDRVFEITPSNNGLSLDELPKIATYIGLNADKFTECLNSGRYEQLVSNQFQEAITAGAGGTPYSIVITKSGKLTSFDGALLIDQVKEYIDNALVN